MPQALVSGERCIQTHVVWHVLGHRNIYEVYGERA